MPAIACPGMPLPRWPASSAASFHLGVETLVASSKIPAGLGSSWQTAPEEFAGVANGGFKELRLQAPRPDSDLRRPLLEVVVLCFLTSAAARLLATANHLPAHGTLVEVEPTLPAEPSTEDQESGLSLGWVCPWPKGLLLLLGSDMF